MTTDRAERRLAAILSADVVGFSRMMGADEAGTLKRLEMHHHNVINPNITAHSGRVVKTTGDGVLVEFASAVDAVECALAIQAATVTYNLDVPDEQKLEFRVGINLGDIIVRGDDIFGDGVNVAVRLERLAQPGGICASRAVRDQVRDKLDCRFDDLGDVEVKNIARAVRVFRVSRGDESAPKAPAQGGSAVSVPSERPSIAVLAFQNMSGDPDQEYFADGIAEDILTALSKFREFVVIARNSSFVYKGKAVDLRQVARELDVRYVLEGSVRQAGQRVRVTGQLIDATTGSHVWAERYDRKLDDIFTVQDEITQQIVGAIAPGIRLAEVQRAQSKGAANLSAWDYVMRAHGHVWRLTEEDSAEAHRLLTKALDLEANNVTALVDLSCLNHFEVIFGWGDPPDQLFAQGRLMAQRAVGIDDHDASAQTALGIYDLFSDQHDDAVERLETAVSLNPNLAFARGYLGVTYAFSGDRPAALACFEQAFRLSPRDPLIVIWHTASSWAALNDQLYNEAIECAKRAVRANPEFADAYGVLAASYGQLGHLVEAGAALEEFERRLPGLTAHDPRLIRPFKRPADRERFLDGLCKAGLPA